MIQNPGSQSFEVAFAGLVPEGHLVNPTSVGYNLISSMIPQGGRITSDLGFSPNDGDQLTLWDEAAQGYDQPITYFAGNGWFDDNFNPAEPSLTVGKGAFLYSQNPNSWVTDFSACSGQITCSSPVVTVNTQKTQGYDQPLTYYAGYGWFDNNINPVEPVVSIGEGAALYNTSDSASWVQDFSPCPGQTLCTSLALSVNALSAGSFSFNISGANGDVWNVDDSSDLVNWQSIGSVTLNNGSGTFTDSQVTGVAYRFYRVNNGTCCSHAIGFVRLTVGLGSTLIANQFNAPANTLNGLFAPTMVDGSSLPDGTIIQKLIGSQSVNYTWSASGQAWSPNGNVTLAPGGCLYN